jgi:hypothetical protein
MDEDAVEGTGEGLERVGEGRQVEGGLGFAGGDDVLGTKSAEDRALRGTKGIADLGEHVHGVLVAGVVEGSVPGGLGADQPAVGAAGGRTEYRCPPIHTEGLGGDGDVETAT